MKNHFSEVKKSLDSFTYESSATTTTLLISPADSFTPRKARKASNSSTITGGHKLFWVNLNVLIVTAPVCTNVTPYFYFPLAKLSMPHAATLLPHHHSHSHTSDWLLPLFSFILPPLPFCTTPTMMPPCQHSCCHLTGTHATTPPVDCYLFLSFCPTSTLCCPLPATTWQPCHHSHSHLWLIVTPFFATTSILHCPLPALPLLPHHHSRCHTSSWL